MRTFNEDLALDLEEPEFAAYYAEAQIESGKELLRCGIINGLTISTQSSKTKHFNWKVRNEKACKEITA